MDNRSSQLVKASFKGVEFDIRNEIASSEGRKIILHEYLNSNQRFVEDLGQLPSSFRINAFVHGIDFKSRAAALSEALNEPGPGILVLPTFEPIEVYALPYTKEASQTEIGEIRFFIEFAAGRPSPGPSQSASDLPEVYARGDIAREQLRETFEESFEPVNTKINSNTAAQDIIESVDSFVASVMNLVPVDDLSSIISTSNSIKQNIFSLIRSPLNLANTLIGSVDAGLYQLISIGLSFSDSLDSVFDSIFPFTNFGSELTDRGLILSDSNVPLWPSDTAARILRNNNRNTIVHTLRVNALINSYEAASAASYKTIGEVDSVISQLENAHETIMLIDTSDESLPQSSPSLRDAVEDIRISALSVIGQKRYQAFSTTTVSVNTPVSSFIEAYSLYGDEFTNPDDLEIRAKELRDLNPDLQATSLFGDIRAILR